MRDEAKKEMKAIKIGEAFGTQMLVHISWVWLLPLAIATLVYLNIEPLVEAVITVGLLFGSVLVGAIARVREANRQGVKWYRVMLFPVGSVVEREGLSRPRSSLSIETTGIITNLALALFFGILFLALPAGALRIEMEIIAIFNLFLAIFATFIRPTPNHDNLLYAWLTQSRDDESAKITLSIINVFLLGLFVIGGLFMLAFDWIAFGWWFLIAVMFSQLTTVAETFGEYTDNMPFAQEHSVMEQAKTDAI